MLSNHLGQYGTHRSTAIKARPRSRTGRARLSEDSRWRNRTEFFQGRPAIIQFLQRKWAKELDYRLMKELWAVTGNRIAVRFQYDWHDDSGNWYRAHGNEQWEFNADGLMRRREASINDAPIREADRLFHWPLGPRPVDHPGLDELGL
jgi:uncharacterized protein